MKRWLSIFLTAVGLCVSGWVVAVAEPGDEKAGTVRESKPVDRTAESMGEARGLLDAGKVNESLAVYDRILSENERNVDALVARGFARLRSEGGVAAALEDFQKVIVLAPEYGDAYVGAAICLYRLGKLQEAEGMVLKAEKLCGSDEVKKERLAKSLWDAGLVKSARSLSPSYQSMSTEAEEVRKVYLDSLRRARDLRIEGHIPEALDVYETLLKQNPQDPDALAGRAFCRLRDASMLDAALADFTQVIKISPDYLDAYIGAAVCHRRAGNFDLLTNILAQAETACHDDPKKVRYLAESAWREGHYVLGRKLDRQHSPAPDRVLIKDPWELELLYAHDWLEIGEDWDEVRLSGHYRVRPDFTMNAELDQWWRYGQDDWSAMVGGNYRHNYRWSASYFFEFSDAAGFLARYRHRPTFHYKLLRRTTLSVGPRFDKYDDSWSERVKFGVGQDYKNWFGEASVSVGRDSSSENVASYSVTAGYNLELRYSLVAGFSTGDETVDFLRGGEVVYRSDRVDSLFARTGFYFSPTTGMHISYLHEWRENDLFRREIALSLFVNF